MPLYDGQVASVYAYAQFMEDLSTATPRDAAKVLAMLENHYCEIGNIGKKTKWNSNEGRHSVEGKSYLVQAAKSFQCRVYGVVGSVKGKPAFFIGAVDPKKKNDKANTKILERAASEAVALASGVHGAKL